MTVHKSLQSRHWVQYNASIIIQYYHVNKYCIVPFKYTSKEVGGNLKSWKTWGESTIILGRSLKCDTLKHMHKSASHKGTTRLARWCSKEKDQGGKSSMSHVSMVICKRLLTDSKRMFRENLLKNFNVKAHHKIILYKLQGTECLWALFCRAFCPTSGI